MKSWDFEVDESMSLSTSKLIDMYEQMVQIRLFEEELIKLIGMGKSLGAVHLYVGEEAVAVGVCSTLQDDDYIVSTHRGHGHCIAKGVDLKYMMAELFQKKTGTNKGKGGSMHIADFTVGMLGACGIVGGGIPIATGAGLSIKLRETDQVAIAFFGDGATNQGTFHESLNMASIWKLPVLYICENNLYGMFTPASYALSLQDVSKKAEAYGIPGVSVDGMQVLDVYHATNAAVKRARKGLGPTLIECKTYRYYEHYGPSEESFYRTKEEREKWKQRDPINSFRSVLIKEGVLTEAELHGLETKIKTEIAEAVTFAEQSPNPDPEDALEDLYV
jgi:pyruvate dehydrogenase E1 component alpha subunit